MKCPTVMPWFGTRTAEIEHVVAVAMTMALCSVVGPGAAVEMIGSDDGPYFWPLQTRPVLATAQPP